MIRVFVEGPIAGCITLEEQLKIAHKLSHCEVVPNIDERALPLRTLGTAGARYIRGLIDSGKHDLIGFGHGRTLAMAADYLPSVDAKGTKFVSLLGGLTRKFAASPFDVIHKLAERTGAEAYVMPVPFFANTKRDREILETQVGVSDVIAMARHATIYLAGIGQVDPKSYLATGGMVDAKDVAELHDKKAAAELLGHFFMEDGTYLPTSVTDRALAPSHDVLKTKFIVALAGGTAKIRAIRALLLSGLLSGLITDEATAKRLVKEIPEREPGSGKANARGNQVA